MVPFDRSYTTFYWSATVNTALSCTVFELFDAELVKVFLSSVFILLPILANKVVYIS